MLDLLFGSDRPTPPGEDPGRWPFEASTGLPPQQIAVGHPVAQDRQARWIATDCDVATVQRALGHAKATTTLNSYAHRRPTSQDRTRQAVTGFVRGRYRYVSC